MKMMAIAVEFKYDNGTVLYSQKMVPKKEGLFISSVLNDNLYNNYCGDEKFNQVLISRPHIEPQFLYKCEPYNNSEIDTIELFYEYIRFCIDNITNEPYPSELKIVNNLVENFDDWMISFFSLDE
jgi:hypothetical protein